MRPSVSNYDDPEAQLARNKERTQMRWESIISTQNLRLAWRRINTGRNLQYKRFFRESYLVYESAIDDHLRELRRALIAGIWEPNHATRLYLPKPSGLQRPLSLLDIEGKRQIKHALFI